MGRPFERRPTAKTRETVIELKLQGVECAEIAAQLGISLAGLWRHYQPELVGARDAQTAFVRQAIYGQAMKGKARAGLSRMSFESECVSADEMLARRPPTGTPDVAPTDLDDLNHVGLSIAET